MTSEEYWVLPQGIQEALPKDAARLETLRRDLLDHYASWGYELVIPPFIDHIESLLTGTGHDLDLQTFKLVDQISGRTLGVRADMTPQVARIDAHQLQREEPNRLCYMGTVLRTRSDGFGRSRSPLQVGAELYGHAGVESDVEILSLMLNTLDIAGVENLYVDIGNVDIFRGLSQSAGLSSENESRLFEMLQRKAIPEIKDLMVELKLSDDMSNMFIGLSELNGDINVLQRAREQLASSGSSVLQAIDYLEQTAKRIIERFGKININFDLAELHGYHYHTGVVFSAFVPTLGEAIARGGRYDDIGQVFGRARAATGFSVDLKLLDSLSSRLYEKTVRVFAPVDDDAALQNKIDELRQQGVCVVQQLPGQSGDATAMACEQTLKLVNNQWQLIQS